LHVIHRVHCLVAAAIAGAALWDARPRSPFRSTSFPPRTRVDVAADDVVLPDEPPNPLLEPAAVREGVQRSGRSRTATARHTPCRATKPAVGTTWRAASPRWPHGVDRGTVRPMPGSSQVAGLSVPGLVALVIVVGVVLAPVLFARPLPSSPDEGPEDDGGGGGTLSPKPPTSPAGGLPLPDAEPSPTRLRSSGRLRDQRRPAPRRPAHQPVRKKREPASRSTAS
jgi:hypothetical protein